MVATKTPLKGTIDNGNKKDAENLSSKWWLEKDDNLYKAVFGITERLNNAQSVRFTNAIRYARLYENVDILSLSTGFYNRLNTSNLPNTRVSYNVVKSCVDSAAAKIAKNRPKVQFLTEEGDYTLQKKAENLTQYTSGLFDQTSANQINQQLFVDAAVWGTGCGYVFKTDDSNIGYERVFAQEITVDDVEAIYGKPQSMFRTKLVSKDVLKEMFPKFKREISKATVRPQQSGSDVLTDQIKVKICWHLKSGPNAKDGKYAICIDTCTLFSDDYQKDSFPFVFFHWNNKLFGFWGQSLAEELAGLQLEINKLLRSVQIAQDRMAVPIIFIESGSGVSDDQMTVNNIANIVKYTGTVPTFMVPPAIAPEIYAHIETLKNNAYEITGISQLSASSKKPDGLDSGVAIREYNDIESERFVLCGQRYEQLFIDLAKLMIDVSRDIYEDKGNISVRVRGNKFIKTIDWKDVNLDEDQYSMQAFPISMLPSTPAGKFAMTQNLIQAGLISNDYALELLDFPDLNEYTSLATASLNTTRMLISQMLDDGKYTPPDPYLNLELALNEAHTTYLRSLQKKNIPEKNLDLLRTFMQDIIEIQNKANPPVPQTPIAAPPQQGQAPIAPVSNLMPQRVPG